MFGLPTDRASCEGECYVVVASTRSRFLIVRLASRVNIGHPTSLNRVPKILPRALCVTSRIQNIST